jgi:hypothetical protein
MGFTVIGSLALLLVAVAPVAAGTRQAVTMTVTTTFDDAPDAFTATGIPGCDSGLVYDGPAHVQFAPPVGVYAGYKIFDCGADNGFVLRLNARFGGSGSTGAWSVVDSWGSAAGMSGSGSLSGDPFDNGILDQYAGTVTF